MELRRWAIVFLMAAVVAATSTRTFLAFYLLIPLGILSGWALLRAVTRLSRGVDQKAAADLREGWRSLARACAWAALCGAVVWGHGVQSAKLRAQAEAFSMSVEDQKQDGSYPERAANVPLGCSYIRGQPARFAIVCSMTPPFEKATYSSVTKRWE